jgi:uncharacterized small protein (DUF1192 family)
MELAIAVLDERLTLFKFYLETTQAVSVQGKPMSVCVAELESAIAILKKHHRSAMTHTIYVLESEVENLSQWMTDPESEDYARLKAQVDEVNQSIAILKQHAAKVPAAPLEFVRDYPNASD